jgi:hypothetical protein
MGSAVRRALLLLAVAVPWSAPAAAQDAHYWTYGYGPIGQLTEGTLVGGVSDLSATFYNPGALALLDKPRFLVGLTSIELANIDAPDIGGDGLDADQLVFDIVPSMVAGQVGGDDGANRFAFAFLSRHDSDWDLGLSATDVSGARPDASAGFGRVRQRLVEYWVGGTWSHRLSDRLSVGISPFFAYRAQRSRRSLEAEEVVGGASRAAFYGREHEYNHVRALAKAGLAWRPGSFELGLAVTTPGAKLWGTGKAVYNASITGAVPTPIVSASVQKDLDASYHSPWAVAGGASWRTPRSAIHTTVEWFSAVDPYTILEPEPAPVSGRPETVSLVYTGAAESVVCFGAGVEHRLGDRLVVYGGFASNQSAYVQARDSFASWDLTDLTLGFTFEKGRGTFAFGAGYAWGDGQLPKAFEPFEPQTQPSSPTLVDASFSRWTFSFGASFK